MQADAERALLEVRGKHSRLGNQLMLAEDLANETSESHFWARAGLQLAYWEES